MPTMEFNELDARISTVWKPIYDDFMEQIKFQENKYPLSEREQMFVDVIKKLLKELDMQSAMRTPTYYGRMEMIGDD